MSPLGIRQVNGWRRLRHQHGGKELRLEAFEVARPLLVVVHTHRQTDGTVVVLREVRETPSGIDDISIVAQMILSSLGAAVIRNSAGRAILPAGAANVTKLRNAGVDRLIDRQVE